MSNNIITSGKTYFEDKLWDGLLNNKSKRFVDGNHIYTIKTEYGDYQFNVGAIHRGLPKTIQITGPVFGRSQKPRLGYVGYLHVMTGKITGPSSQRDKHAADLAVDTFLRKYADGISRSLLGWDVSGYEGWVRVLKRTRAGPKKEVAILAAAMPGRTIDEYNPEGTKKLQYSEYIGLGIPPALYEYVRKQMEKSGVFDDLYQSYMTVKRRVSAWEDGPGYKHFRGT
jgi:hypothetical protein